MKQAFASGGCVGGTKQVHFYGGDAASLAKVEFDKGLIDGLVSWIQVCLGESDMFENPRMTLTS